MCSLADLVIIAQTMHSAESGAIERRKVPVARREANANQVKNALIRKRAFNAPSVKTLTQTKTSTRPARVATDRVANNDCCRNEPLN